MVYPYSTVTDCFSTNTFDPKNSNKKDVESILFSFDLKPDKCNGFHLHQNTSRIVDLETIFAKPVQQAITILCYSAYEGMIAITKERNVLAP